MKNICEWNMTWLLYAFLKTFNKYNLLFEKGNKSIINCLTGPFIINVTHGNSLCSVHTLVALFSNGPPQQLIGKQQFVSKHSLRTLEISFKVLDPLLRNDQKQEFSIIHTGKTSSQQILLLEYLVILAVRICNLSFPCKLNFYYNQ